jgi:hypothetical protein
MGIYDNNDAQKVEVQPRNNQTAKLEGHNFGVGVKSPSDIPPHQSSNINQPEPSTIDNVVSYATYTTASTHISIPATKGLPTRPMTPTTRAIAKEATTSALGDSLSGNRVTTPVELLQIIKNAEGDDHSVLNGIITNVDTRRSIASAAKRKSRLEQKIWDTADEYIQRESQSHTKENIPKSLKKPSSLRSKAGSRLAEEPEDGEADGDFEEKLQKMKAAINKVIPRPDLIVNEEQLLKAIEMRRMRHLTL